MEQQIRFCTTSDGVRIAYATVGRGPPLVLATGWLSHLQVGWNQPETRAYLEGLAKGRLLVRFDKRGMGLSDRDVYDHSMEAHLADLEAVLNALTLDHFSLMGFSEGGPTAIMYAARHPQSVSDLILYGSYHRWPHPRRVVEPLLALIRAEWGLGSAALSAAFVPSRDPIQTAWWTDMERVSASGENAARVLEVNMGVDVTAWLKEIRVPTLVLHRRGDAVAPFAVAREMAALIPGARLEPLEGNDHPAQWGDSEAVLDAIATFLREREAEVESDTTASALVTILFTDMEGSTALTQRLGDAKAQDLLRAHNTIIRDALKAHGGSEIKHTGDGIMASFGSASGALECAVGIQGAFEERNRHAVGAHHDAPLRPAVQAGAATAEPIRVRIGLNAGEPVAEDGDIFGAAVQLAARVCAKAEAGQVLVSNVVRELAMGKGFLFADVGDVVLKGFEDPVRLYEVRRAE